MHRDARNHALPFLSNSIWARSHSIQFFLLHHSKRVQVPRCIVQYYLFYTENSELLGGARQYVQTYTPLPRTSTADRFHSIPLHLCDEKNKFAPPLFISPSLRCTSCMYMWFERRCVKVRFVSRPVMISMHDVTPAHRREDDGLAWTSHWQQTRGIYYGA